MDQELTASVRTRFAPSPTGMMHVGNLRTALYAYLLAKSKGGSFILRIEDTDRTRMVDQAVEVIYKTLDAAGLKHDEGPDVGGPCGPYVQSERQAAGIYMKYAKMLVEKGAAYYCFCDKADPLEESHEPEEASFSAGYNGHCRNLPQEEVSANLAAGKPFVIRQKINREGSTTYQDAVFGEITIKNDVLDDQILIKRDGFPTYNFANVVDDHLMGITHVVRGAEYLSSTPKYNMLYEAFGWTIPVYVHLPLIMGRDAEGNVAKLSKRHGSVSFENLCAEGYLPEAIVNYIALLGWNPKNEREIFSLPELVEAFNISGLNKASAIFDYEKLAWLNGEYIRKMTPAQLGVLIAPYTHLQGTRFEPVMEQLAALLQPRLSKLSEAGEKLAFLLQCPDYGPDLFFNKKNKVNAESSREILSIMIPRLSELKVWNAETINDAITACASERSCKYLSVMLPLLFAVSGLKATPGGASDLMALLGREESLARLETALAKLS